MTGLGRSTIDRLQAGQQFPQNIKLGIDAVGWRGTPW
jgi:predicted DNA-binding transcriptional regulator AlpA